ncbi:MAG: GIY-YIG nuclease family protein [Acidobacteriota bacterium]|nr:GIY-YIG nuclease family protein [Acidobacteriota bacterium]
MPKGFTEQDAALLDELGVEVAPKKVFRRTVREGRIIAGFEEIQRFMDLNGRAPDRAASRDTFERLYAVRLDRIVESEECRKVLTRLDRHGLLREGAGSGDKAPDTLDDDALLSELGIEAAATGITELRHVRSSAEKRVAEEIASRTKCRDYEQFRPLFEQAQREIEEGIRITRPFERKAEIEPGRFFVVGGQKAYVASMGRVFTQKYGDKDARLRVIFDNGTESNLLRRSLQRALHKDPAGRRITEPTAGPLFDRHAEEGDQASGTIYVLRSKSDLPRIAEHRQLIHKIGVTSGEVQERIAGARLQPTFLMADVEIVAAYQLFNIDRSKLERLVHRFFDPARLDIEIKDRFGNPVRPREWFLVPLAAIDDAVEKIRDGTITLYRYDANAASLVVRTTGCE